MAIESIQKEDSGAETLRDSLGSSIQFWTNSLLVRVAFMENLSGGTSGWRRFWHRRYAIDFSLPFWLLFLITGNLLLFVSQPLRLVITDNDVWCPMVLVLTPKSLKRRRFDFLPFSVIFIFILFSKRRRNCLVPKLVRWDLAFLGGFGYK